MSKKFKKLESIRIPLLSKLLKEITLETAIKVSNQIFAIHLIHELGFRESKVWDENNIEDEKLLKKLTELANEHTVHIMKKIEKHKSK